MYLNINESLILDCLNELNKNAQAKQKYKDYYEGNHSILKNYQMQDSRSNMKLVFNYPRKFVDNETGYILGKPINYISKSDDTTIIDAIDRNTSHWDKEHNINLRKQSEVYGEVYELNYVNAEGGFSATILTPLESYVLEDATAERNVLLALHTFTKKFDNKKYMDVYTDSEILHYELGSNSNMTRPLKVWTFKTQAFFKNLWRLSYILLEFCIHLLHEVFSFDNKSQYTKILLTLPLLEF